MRIAQLASLVMALGLFVMLANAQERPCIPEKFGDTLNSADDLNLLVSTTYRMNQCVSVATDPQDYFRFRIAVDTTFNLSVGAELGTRGGEFLVELFDRNGVRIAEARGGGERAANIGRALSAGTYHVKVSA